MRDRQRAFTIVELMIVLTVIGILAGLVIVNLMASKSAAHEAGVIASLRTISTAQAQFRLGARADVNADGGGEYGGFVELSGRARGRQISPLAPPVLSGVFRELNANGEASTAGYLFRMFLPDAAGSGVGEPQAGFSPSDPLDPARASATWCCYAWPTNYGRSGSRTYMVNQSAQVIWTDAPAYSGTGRGPRPDAGFLTADAITGPLALGVAGQDGNAWNAAP